MRYNAPAMYSNGALPNKTASREGPLPYKWLAFITAAGGNLLATVTMSIVNISLPSIAQSFAASMVTVQWVIVIYPLITVSLMLAVGYLADVGGRKRIFAGGALLFALTSFLCGMAQTPVQLIVFRALQAVGGSMVIANSAAIVTAAFPPQERGKSLGMLSTVAGIGLSIGPSLGGILVDTAGWRWVFFVAVPLSALTVLLSMLYLRDEAPKRAKGQPFDTPGAVILFLLMASFLLALSEGQQNGWASPAFAALALFCLASLAAFARVERRAAMPTVDLQLLGRRLFATAMATGLLSYIAMFATMFLMPFYLTRTAGYSSSEAGLLLTTIPLAMALMSTVAGWLCDRFGSRWLCGAGMLLCTLSLLLLAQLGRSASYDEAGGRLLLLGLGLGLFMTPNNSAMMSCVPPARLGLASALVAEVRHLGSALGVALASVIFTARLEAHGAGGTATGEVFDAAASVGAFRDTYLALGVLCAAGVVGALVRGKGDRLGGNQDGPGRLDEGGSC